MSVVHIANQAEFTLCDVQTVQGRSATVYAIQLDVPNPDNRQKPGMLADVTFMENWGVRKVHRRCSRLGACAIKHRALLNISLSSPYINHKDGQIAL